MKGNAFTILLVLSALPVCAEDEASVSVTPVVNYVTVHGNGAKFREDWGIRDGWTGGINEFTLAEKLNKDWKLNIEGRSIFDEQDYRLQLSIVNEKVGFFRAGFTEFRQNYNDTGGFYRPFSVPAMPLHRDLFLRNGNFFFEAGLTLPDIPKITLGYERQYRDGEQSLLEWGSVTEGTATRKILPAFKDVDETVDIFKLQAEHDIGAVHVADLFRYEHYRDDTKRSTSSTNLVNGAGNTVTIKETYRHDSFFNTFRMDCHVNETFYWSLGYMFNTLSGNGGLNVITPPPLGPFDRNWITRALDVDLDSHVLNFNVMVGPFGGLVGYAGAQSERTETHGFMDALLTDGVSAATTNRIQSSNDKRSLEETLGVRYTKIPFTTVYAESRWTEEQIGLDEHETEDGMLDFSRSTDADVFRQDYTVGFNSAPLPRATLAGRYRRSMYNNDYDHNVDTEPGYPAFITGQDFTTDEVMGKLTLRPMQRLTVALKYQKVATDIHTATQPVALLAPGGSLLSGNYDANIYTVSATVTPIARLYLTGLFSYLDTRTTASANGNPAVVSYRGNVYSALGAAGYALDDKTDVTAEYTYSQSDTFHNNSAAGLPLGVDYERHGVLVGLSRQITKNLIARLRYGFFCYHDGIDNYRAQLASISWTLRF